MFAELGLEAVGALQAHVDKEESVGVSASGLDGHNIQVGALGELKPSLVRILQLYSHNNSGYNPCLMPEPPLKLRKIKLPLRSDPNPKTHRLLQQTGHGEAQSRLHGPEHELVLHGLPQDEVAIHPLELGGTAAGSRRSGDGARFRG